MKLLITLLFSALLYFPTYSQHISAGLRTGVNRAQDIQQLKLGAIRHTWDKDAFIRLETNKRLAFEVNATQYNYQENDPTYNTMLICWPTEDYYKHDRLFQMNNMNMMDLGVSIQYQVFKNKKASCPLFKNIDNYIGANILYTHAFITTEYHEREIESGEQVTTEVKESQPYNLQFGLSNTIIYRFKHFYICGVGAFLVNPLAFEDNSGFLPMLPLTHNNSIAAKIGVGCTF